MYGGVLFSALVFCSNGGRFVVAVFVATGEILTGFFYMLDLEVLCSIFFLLGRGGGSS